MVTPGDAPRHAGWLARLERRGPVFWLVTGTLCVGLVGIADVATGPELSFGLFYLLPVVLVTWFTGSRADVAPSRRPCGSVPTPSMARSIRTR